MGFSPWRCLLLSLLLVGSFVLALDTAQKSTCTVKDDKIKKHVEPEFGPYTKGMGNLMRAIIDQNLQQAMQTIGKIVEKPENAEAEIKGIIAGYSAVIAIFSILLIISVAIIIATVVMFIVRCCCKDKKDGKNPKTYQMILVLVFILVCAGICTGGAIAFLESITNMRNGLSGIGEKLEEGAQDIGQFIKNYEDFMVCEKQRQTERLDVTTKDAKNNVELAAKKFEERLDATIQAAKETRDELDKTENNLNKQFGNQPIINSLIPTGELKNVRDILTVVITEMEKFKKTISKANDQVDGKVKDLKNGMTNALQRVLDVVRTIKKKIKTIQGEMKSIFVKVDEIAGNVGIGLQVTIVLPLTLVCIMAFGFVVLFMRFLHNWGVMKCCSEKLNTRLSKVAARIMAIAGYAAMLISSLVFIMAAICFLIAFASMFMCMTLFDDPEFIVFESLPPKLKTISHSNYSYSFHEALIKCRNDYPFFDAIDGHRQMADEKLEPTLVDIQSKDFSKEFRSFQAPGNDKFDELNKRLNDPALLMAQTYTDSLIKKVKQFEKAFNSLISRSLRDELANDIDIMVEDLTDKISDHVADLISSLLDLSPQCDGLMKIWDKAGNIVCNDVSMPAQGAWMACVICGIGSFTVFHWMFTSTKYLDNFVEEDKKKAESRMESVKMDGNEECKKDGKDEKKGGKKKKGEKSKETKADKVEGKSVEKRESVENVSVERVEKAPEQLEPPAAVPVAAPAVAEKSGEKKTKKKEAQQDTDDSKKKSSGKSGKSGERSGKKNAQKSGKKSKKGSKKGSGKEESPLVEKKDDGGPKEASGAQKDVPERQKEEAHKEVEDSKKEKSESPANPKKDNEASSHRPATEQTQ